MDIRQINEDYAVSGQIDPAEVAGLKAAGFRGVICHRPDDEQPGQPSAATVRAAVEAEGLAFRHIPVVSGQITADDVGAMAKALDEMEGPIFGYCRSGARSTNIYALARQSAT